MLDRRPSRTRPADVRAFDLIEIGDGTTIGVDSRLAGAKVEDGWLDLKAAPGAYLGQLDVSSERRIFKWTLRLTGEVAVVRRP
jgi:hypothetical protein